MSFPEVNENQELTGKLIFELWLEFDTYKKVALYLASKGLLSKKVKKPFHQRTLATLSRRYILDNSEEALSLARAKGRNLSDAYWEQFLVKSAYTEFVMIGRNRIKFYDWLKSRNLYDKYKNYRRYDTKPAI